MIAVALLLVASAALQGSPLPLNLGPFTRGEFAPLAIAPGERELYEEFGWKSAHTASYTDAHRRQMRVDAYRFADAAGAHAAYLCSRPAGGISPWIWNLDATTGSGVTVLEYRNYMFRFHGAVPGISSELEEMLAKLPALTAGAKPWDLSGRYVVPLSTRMIPGPVSLRRFVGRISPSLAAFRLGATGRMARFETPAGPITEVVFEYPTRELAAARAKALATLPNAVVRVNRTCAAVVFDSKDQDLAEELLRSNFCAPAEISFNQEFWVAPPTLAGELESLLLWGVVGGMIIAWIRRSERTRDPFPERMIFLRL